MEYVGDLLGGALAGFAAVVDPEAIVIGGGVSKAGQPLIDCIQKYYMKYAFHPAKIHRLFLQHLEMTLGSAAQLKWFFKNNILRIKDRKIRDKYIEEAFYKREASFLMSKM